MHSSNTDALNVTVFTNHSVICNNFSPYRIVPLIKILIFMKSSQSFSFTIDSPLYSKTPLKYGSIHNMHYCHQSGTCSWRDTHRRQNHLVCSDPLIILTDKGHIADLFQVLHIFQHFTWTFQKNSPSLVITWYCFTDLTTINFTVKQEHWI